MNLKRCRRCGKDVVAGWHATNKRFCSRDCYDTWWNDYRTQHVTRAEVAEKTWGKAPNVPLELHEATWLAALIDGEGCIGIWRERRPKNKSGWSYRPVIQIVNSNRALIEATLACVDGFAHWKNIKRDNPKHKPTYGVTVNRRAVAQVLEQVKPYLVAKKKQAAVVIEFCRVFAASPMRAGENHDMFETLYQECKALNKRGL